MIKADLVNELAKLGITKKQAQVAVDTVFGTIRSQLKKGGKVSVVGFGTFMVKKKAARQGRNPSTGEGIHIPAKLQPVFKPGTALKEMVKRASVEGEE